MLVWAGELGLIERDRWEREPLDERVECVRSMQSTLPPWWAQQKGPGWSMWGSSTGPAAGSLQRNRFQRSDGDTYPLAQ